MGHSEHFDIHFFMDGVCDQTPAMVRSKDYITVHLEVSNPGFFDFFPILCQRFTWVNNRGMVVQFCLILSLVLKNPQHVKNLADLSTSLVILLWLAYGIIVVLIVQFKV